MDVSVRDPELSLAEGTPQSTMAVASPLLVLCTTFCGKSLIIGFSRSKVTIEIPNQINDLDAKFLKKHTMIKCIVIWPREMYHVTSVRLGIVQCLLSCV